MRPFSVVHITVPIQNHLSFNPAPEEFLVEPEESTVLSGGKS
jgi:hypothetical protein